ncbi:unnamed protein product [Aspergillus oryzae]|nr:unnamed protein product [Aspergillus oryzae]
MNPDSIVATELAQEAKNRRILEFILTKSALPSSFASEVRRLSNGASPWLTRYLNTSTRNATVNARMGIVTTKELQVINTAWFVCLEDEAPSSLGELPNGIEAPSIGVLRSVFAMER